MAGLPNLTLGIDTSNYTTSAALVDMDGNVLADARKMLLVEQGKRGLRQSEALFQHVQNLPEVFEELAKQYERKYRQAMSENIRSVGVSSKPRPVDGSYMPCFLPGLQFAKTLATTLSVPCHIFSHQEGHMAALLPETNLSMEEGFLSFHMSGGTCELLSAVYDEEKHARIQILGGSKDISFGQFIDRIGVALGFSFPCGKEMDRLAGLYMKNRTEILRGIHFEDGWMQIAGLETAAQRYIRDLPYEDKTKEEVVGPLAAEIFMRITKALIKTVTWGADKTGLQHVMLVGGVAGSRTIGDEIKKYNKQNRGKVQILMPGGERARDNAIGVALLGREGTWQ